MRHPARSIGRALWVAFACLLLVPTLAAAADESLALDFDGDGRRDQVTLDRREPSVLRVWLSASDSRQVIHSGAPLVRVIATDLDGDHRPELITRDSEWQLQAWTWQRQAFHRFRAHNAVPGTERQPSRRSVDDQDSEPAGATTGSAFAPFAVEPTASPRASSLERSSRCGPDSTRACRPFAALEPLGPRPPPARFAL